MACFRQRGCDGGEGYECIVCPYQFGCPTCHVGAGSPCKRPSGHTCRVHEPRVVLADEKASQPTLAERMDAVRQYSGQVPDAIARERARKRGLV